MNRGRDKKPEEMIRRNEEHEKSDGKQENDLPDANFLDAEEGSRLLVSKTSATFKVSPSSSPSPSCRPAGGKRSGRKSKKQGKRYKKIRTVSLSAYLLLARVSSCTRVSLPPFSSALSFRRPSPPRDPASPPVCACS